MICSATTAKGKPCKRSALIGTDPGLCVAHAGGNGRKSVLDQELIARIAQMIRAGNYVEVACAAAGVSRQTFYNWLAEGEADKAAPIYKEFRDRIDAARAEGEARNVALIAKAAAASWQAAAWMLERQYPDRWARPSQRQDDSDAGAKQGVPDPFEALDELAVRRSRAS